MNSLRLACVLTFAGLVATACSSESSEEGPGDFLSVLQTAPQDGTDQAPTAARIGFQIDAAIDPATLTSANFFVTDENGAPLTGTPTVLDDDSSAAELILDAPMEVITTYRATITTGLRSTGGVALEENFEWTFTTLDSAWGISEWIEEDVNGTSAEQDIAVDAQSNAIAVWEHETAAGTAIWANRYTRTDLWGEPVPIDRGSGTVARPSVATDDAGNGIAVWERINEGGVAANIWTNRYDVAAGTWGTAELLQSGEITQAEQASVAAAPSGDAVATWVQTDADTGRDVVWARTYSAGSGWGEAGLISEGIPESFLAGNSTLGMDGAGNAIAVWSRRTVDGDVIWANRYVPTGGWGEAAIIKSDPATSARRVRLSVGDAGDAFVVWIQGDGQRDDVWSTRFSGTWGEPGRIDAYDAANKRDVDVAVDGAGVAHAVWSQEDPDFVNIWANRYTLASGWEEPQLIEPPNEDPLEDADATLPRAGVNAAGNAFVVWLQTSNGWRSVWSNRRDPESDWLGAELIEDIERPAKAAIVVVDDERHAHALWLHFVDQGFDWVRTNRFE